MDKLDCAHTWWFGISNDAHNPGDLRARVGTAKDETATQPNKGPTLVVPA